MDNAEEDDTLFEKQDLFKIVIDPNITCEQCKVKIVEEYNRQNPDVPITLERIRLRNPRLDDFGDVITNSTIMENCYLYDGKELYVQLVDEKTCFEFVNKLQPDNCYYILTREWNP